MSWNGSDQSSSSSRRRVGSPRPSNPDHPCPPPPLLSTSSRIPRPLLRGTLAGLVVVALAAAALWYFVLRNPQSRTTNHEPRTTTSPRHIAAANPQLATNKTAAAQPAPPPKPERPQIAGEIRNGYRLLANGRLHKVVGVHTSHVSRISLAMKTFDHPANQSIASLLTVEPGDSLLGDSSSYYQGFTEHFKDSAKENIEIKPDDSDEVKALKEAVISTRKELQAMLDKGQDIDKVMREEREQLREIGLYREDLAKQVKEIAGNLETKLSEKDLADLVEAANKMLEERGSQPLMMTAPLLYQLREEKLEKTRQTQGE